MGIYIRKRINKYQTNVILFLIFFIISIILLTLFLLQDNVVGYTTMSVILTLIGASLLYVWKKKEDLEDKEAEKKEAKAEEMIRKILKMLEEMTWDDSIKGKKKWEYSEKFKALLIEYQERFPELVSRTPKMK